MAIQTHPAPDRHERYHTRWNNCPSDEHDQLRWMLSMHTDQESAFLSKTSRRQGMWTNKPKVPIGLLRRILRASTKISSNYITQRNPLTTDNNVAVQFASNSRYIYNVQSALNGRLNSPVGTNSPSGTNRHAYSRTGRCRIYWLGGCQSQCATTHRPEPNAGITERESSSC